MTTSNVAKTAVTPSTPATLASSAVSRIINRASSTAAMAPIASATSVTASTWWRRDRACRIEAAQHERGDDRAAYQRGKRDRRVERLVGERFAPRDSQNGGHGSNRYPTPHTVVIQRGLSGLSSSFWRSRPTWTVTVAES